MVYHLRCYRFYLGDVPRPSESTICESFVQQQESIAFIEQAFYAVRLSSAEKEQVSLPQRDPS